MNTSSIDISMNSNNDTENIDSVNITGNNDPESKSLLEYELAIATFVVFLMAI